MKIPTRLLNISLQQSRISSSTPVAETTTGLLSSRSSSTELNSTKLYGDNQVYKQCLERVKDVILGLSSPEISLNSDSETQLILLLVLSSNSPADLFFALSSFWRYTVASRPKSSLRKSPFNSSVTWFSIASQAPQSISLPAVLETASILNRNNRPNAALDLLDYTLTVLTPPTAPAGSITSDRRRGSTASASSPPGTPRSCDSRTASTTSSPETPHNRHDSLGPSFLSNSSLVESESEHLPFGWQLVLSAQKMSSFEIAGEDILALAELEQIFGSALRFATKAVSTGSNDELYSSTMLDASLELPEVVLLYYFQGLPINIWNLIRSLLNGLINRVTELTQYARIYDLCLQMHKFIPFVLDMTERYEILALCASTLVKFGWFDEAVLFAMNLQQQASQDASVENDVELYEGLALASMCECYIKTHAYADAKRSGKQLKKICDKLTAQLSADLYDDDDEEKEFIASQVFSFTRIASFAMAIGRYTSGKKKRATKGLQQACHGVGAGEWDEQMESHLKKCLKACIARKPLPKTEFKTQASLDAAHNSGEQPNASEYWEFMSLLEYNKKQYRRSLISSIRGLDNLIRRKRIGNFSSKCSLAKRMAQALAHLHETDKVFEILTWLETESKLADQLTEMCLTYTQIAKEFQALGNFNGQWLAHSSLLNFAKQNQIRDWIEIGSKLSLKIT